MEEFERNLLYTSLNILLCRTETILYFVVEQEKGPIKELAWIFYYAEQK